MSVGVIWLSPGNFEVACFLKWLQCIASLASSIVSAVVETVCFYSWLDRFYFPNAARGRIKDRGVDADTDGTTS
jgi:hypothetical protein